jgi:hypothetical protein
LGGVRIAMLRARDCRRVLLSVLAAAGVAISCDSPSGPVRHAVSLALEPMLNVAMGSFGGLTVDQVQLIAVHGADTVHRTFPFSPDSTQITTELSLPVSDTATYTVTVDLLATGTLMFTGQVQILVTAGRTAPPVRVVLRYVGPGMNIDSVRIAPRDSIVAPSGQLPFRIAAYDSTGAPVAQFYVHWATSSASNVINANGLFRAGATKGAVWVYASTPTGVQDSTQVTVGTGLAGVPTAVTKVAGDAQSATAGTAVAIAPKVLVTDAFADPVAGVAVTFAVASGGGSITGASATTDASGFASVGSWTLGSIAGVNTLTATVTGLTPVTFTATGTAPSPTISLTVPGGLVGIGALQQAQAVIVLSQGAPAGGVTVTLVSDSTQYITIPNPATIFFPAGTSFASKVLAGVAPGVSVLHASAPGYTASADTATATPNFVTLTYDSVAVGGTKTVGVALSTPAPAGGLPVLLISEDSTKFEFINGAVTNPPVGTMVDTISAGSSSLNVTITGLSAGVVPIIAAASNYALGIEVVIVTPSNGSLALVSGGGQTGAVNTPLPQPIVVRVTNPAGGPLSGYLVSFTVASGGGSVSPVAALTDASGQASTSWTLGPAHGTQTLSVIVTGATGSPLTVTATAP